MIKVYLAEYNNTKNNIMLPVPPKSFPIKMHANNKTYNLLNYGEVTRIKIPKQYTITISSFFPSKDIYFPYPHKYGFKCSKPEEYKQWIINHMYSKTPIKLSLRGSVLGDFTANVTIESFEVTQPSGNSGNIDYNLTLKEYRTVETKYLAEVTIKELPELEYDIIGGKEEPEPKQTTKDIISKQVDTTTGEFVASHMERLQDAGITSTMNYSVMQDGENFTDIIKKYYGTTEVAQAVMVYKANSKIKNYNKLKAGTTIVLPPISELR